jgi:hypothetical protein
MFHLEPSPRSIEESNSATKIFILLKRGHPMKKVLSVGNTERGRGQGNLHINWYVGVGSGAKGVLGFKKV